MKQHLSEIKIEEYDKLSMEPYYQFLIRYQDTKNYILTQFDEILSKVKSLKQNISQKSSQEQRDYINKGHLDQELKEYSNKLDQLRNFCYQEDRIHFRLNYLEKFQIKAQEKEVFKCEDHDKPYTKICQQKHAQDKKYLFCDQCELIEDCLLENFENTENYVNKMFRYQFQEIQQHIDTQIQFLYQRIATEEEQINDSIQKLGQFNTIKSLINQEEPFKQSQQILKEINQLKNFKFQYQSHEQQKLKLQKLDRLKFDICNYQTIEIEDICPKFEIIEYNSQQYTQRDKIIIQNEIQEINMYQNQGQGILVPTQISYKYKYVHLEINQQPNIFCQMCQKNMATNISMNRQLIQLFCENCSCKSQSKILLQVDDLSKYSNSIQSTTQRQILQQNQQNQYNQQNQQNQENQKLDPPFKFAFELYCQRQGHEDIKINAICLSKSCDQVDCRLCCENCFQIHQHNGINQVKTIKSFQFDKNLDWYSIIERMVSIDDKVQNFTRNINKQILSYLRQVYKQRNLYFKEFDNYSEINQKFKNFVDQQKTQQSTYEILHQNEYFQLKKLLQNVQDFNQKLSSISQANNINRPQMIELLHCINFTDFNTKINKFEKGIIGHQIYIKSTKPCMIDKIILPQYSPKIDLTLLLQFQNYDLIINEIKAVRNLSNSSIGSIISQKSQSQSQLKTQSKKDKVIIKLDKPLFLLAGMVYKLKIYSSHQESWQMEEYRQVIDSDHHSLINQFRIDGRQTDEDKKYIMRQFILQCQVLIF